MRDAGKVGIVTNLGCVIISFHTDIEGFWPQATGNIVDEISKKDTSVVGSANTYEKQNMRKLKAMMVRETNVPPGPQEKPMLGFIMFCSLRLLPAQQIVTGRV